MNKEVRPWSNLYSPMRPQLVYVAAKLKLADILKDGCEAGYEELVHQTGADAQALLRVLRGLVMIGILREQDQRFSLTPEGEFLRSDHPDSIRDAAIVNGELSAAWSGLFHAVQTGEPAFNHVFGSGLFDYLNARPELCKSFNHFMAQMTGRIADEVITTYDFSSFQSVVDVGGGFGTLLAAILSKNPSMRGVLFDLPDVIDHVHAGLSISSYLERCELIKGSFFESIPAHGDIYILQLVLHDWDDLGAATIVRNCRRAMAANARLLIIERLLTHDLRDTLALIEGDLDMLVLTGGRERTESEIRAICSAEGLTIINTIPLGNSWMILEAVATQGN